MTLHKGRGVMVNMGLRLASTRGAVSALLLVLLVTTTACGGNGGEASTAGQSPATTTTAPAGEPEPDPGTGTPAAGGVTITTGDSAFGSVLFDGARQAIYIWQVETDSEPRCYDSCATAWPPVLTEGEPSAAGDVTASLLGTVARSDGTTQVTYNGHPLYYYAHEGPGEVKCHNVATHGGLWWVIKPDGDRVA